MREYKGVPMGDEVADHEGQNDDYAAGWKDGVDAAQRAAGQSAVSRPGGEDVRLDAPEDMDAVRVLVAVAQDNLPGAGAVVRGMSPRDRAVLTFYLREAGRLVEHIEEGRIYG